MEKDAQGAGTRFLPSSQTDQAGEGAWAYLSPVTMAAIARWRDKADIRKGPLFRRAETHFDGSGDETGRAALHPTTTPPSTKRLLPAPPPNAPLGEMTAHELVHRGQAGSW